MTTDTTAATLPGLNRQAIETANGASHFEAGSALEREAIKEIEADRAKLAPRQGWTPEQIAYAARRADEYRALIIDMYNDLIGKRARVMPWTVCGPANYPVKRQRKASDALDNASNDWEEKKARFWKNTAAGLLDCMPPEERIKRYADGRDTSPISSDDPQALEKLTARLQHLTESQQVMKDVNAYYRKHGTVDGAPHISEKTAGSIKAAMARDWRKDPRPFEAYHLSNNSANMARIRQRIAQIEKERQAAPVEPVQAGNAPGTFQGFTLTEDAADMRIRFVFEEKPGEDTRSLLKRHGFKWSPRAGAWQRMLNGNGRYAAREVIKALAPEAQEQPDALTLDEFAALIGDATKTF